MKNLLVVIFLMASAVSFAQINPMKAMKAEQAKAKAAQAEAEKAREEAIALYYADRSETPGADVASDKQNIPVKKESFEALLARYKENGFEIAVQFTTGPVYTKAPSSSGNQSSMNLNNGDRQIVLSGSLPSMKNELAPLASSFAKKMNEEFNTDLFKVIDMKTMPYKETKYGKKDNWEATKYKMVVIYTVNLVYDYRIEGKYWKADFNANMNVRGTDYQYDKKKGVKLKGVFNGSLGGFNVSLEQEEAFGVKKVEELDAIVNPPKGEGLLQELEDAQAMKFEKFIEKLKK